jgi:uncharacterized protein (DUF1778 family)
MPPTKADKTRITARVPAEVRATLEQAARLQGATLNQFVVQSAFQEAQRILERETVIQLPNRMPKARSFSGSIEQGHAAAITQRLVRAFTAFLW